MVWLVRTLVICVFALDGPIILAPNHQPPVMNFLSGLLAGLFVIWLSSLLGSLSKRVHAKYPVGAKRAGIAFYGVGTAIAALYIGLAAFAAYTGASRELVGVTASCAIVYWAAGWGLYRALTQESGLRRAIQRSAEELVLCRLSLLGEQIRAQRPRSCGPTLFYFWRKQRELHRKIDVLWHHGQVLIGPPVLGRKS